MSTRLRSLLRSYSLNPYLLWKNISWRFPKSPSKGKYIFIVGSPRSGTTLLQTMLSQHDSLSSIDGETGLFSYKNIFDPNRYHFRLSVDQTAVLLDQCSDLVEFFDRCVEVVNSGDNNRRFIEKTPQHVLHLEFILKWFPNASILHIVRDGRDCYCSSKINVDIPQNSSVKVFAKYWRKCVSKPIQHFDNQKIFTIKYEDLVASPKLELSAIMQFLDLKVEDSQFDASRYAQDIRSKRIEFQKLASEINTSSINRWRNELSESELTQFDEIARDQLRFYGYS